MAKLKDLKVTVGLSKKGIAKLNADLRRTKANFRRNFGEIQAMAIGAGKNLSMGLTAPLALMAVQSVKAFDTQAKAIAQVEAGLKSTGSQVGFTSQQLQQMASDLQAKTLFGDEVILKDATAQLLTFTNISENQFARTQKAALDLATRLDGDLKSASIQLGKALNDPVANLSALSRSGIQFSAEQKEVIKSLAETNQLAEAQNIILDELDKQYGGSAEAAATAGTGGFKQLANTLGDLSEEFGKLISEFIQPLIPKIQEIVRSFTDLTTRQQQVILGLSAIAAMAGPILLLAGGLMKARAAMLLLNTAMLTNPIGGVAIAVTALITALGSLKAITKTTREETDLFIESTKELEKQQALLALNTKRRALESELASLQQAKALEEAASAAGSLGDKFEKNISRGNVTRFNDQIEDTSSAILELKKAIATLQFGEGDVFAGVGLDVDGDDIKTQGVQIAQVERATLAHAKSAKEVENHALQNRKLKSSYTDLSSSLQPVLNKFNELGAVVGQQLPSFFEGAFTSLMEGTKSFGQFMLQTLQRLIIKAAALAATFVALSVLLGGATGVAEAVGGKAGLGNFLLKGFGIPQMAEGGIFSGASLAMVGEGPGTSSINPEVVAPLDKLKNMMGGQNVNVTGTIRGRDLLLSEERSAYSRRRRFGN